MLQQTFLPVCGAIFFLACGSKSGLNAPDALVEDAAVEDVSMPAEEVPCTELAFEGEEVLLDVSIEAEVGRADVVFLIDRTASMREEIARIRDTLREEIAPGIREKIPDSNFAVGTFADFPVAEYGAAGDEPFRLMFPMTADVERVQSAIGSITLGDGLDEPESQVEAMYQLITGEGIGDFVPPSGGCPSGGIGYVCFREDAARTVLLFTDASFHNGPGSVNPYVGISPPPHRFDEAMQALMAEQVRVLGFDSGGGAASFELNQTAIATGALSTTGEPLVYRLARNGRGLSSEVVSAIQAFADSETWNVDTLLVDLDPADDIDPRDFVLRLEAVSAVPESGVDSIDREGGVFLGADAGTQLQYRLVLRNDAVVSGAEPQTFRLRVVFRGNQQTFLGQDDFDFVVPSEDGVGCEP